MSWSKGLYTTHTLGEDQVQSIIEANAWIHSSWTRLCGILFVSSVSFSTEGVRPGESWYQCYAVIEMQDEETGRFK